MQLVGVDTEAVFVRRPLRMTYPDGTGLALPDWPARWTCWQACWVRGWRWTDKLALLATAARWQTTGFTCSPHTTVAGLCARLPQRLQQNSSPLVHFCTQPPANRASGQDFLRVLKRCHVWRSQRLQPAAATRSTGHTLAGRGGELAATAPQPADLRLGVRVTSCSLPQRRCRNIKTIRAADTAVDNTHPSAAHSVGPQWAVNGEVFDHVVLANSASKQTSELIQQALAASHESGGNQNSLTNTDAMAFEAIATVYAWAGQRSEANPNEYGHAQSPP